MPMTEFTLEELGLFLGVSGAAVGACIVAILRQLQKSRCKRVRCCGLDCERSAELNLPDVEVPHAPADDLTLRPDPQA